MYYIVVLFRQLAVDKISYKYPYINQFSQRFQGGAAFLRNPKDFLKELEAPCGQFRFRLPVKDRLKLGVLKWLVALDFLPPTLFFQRQQIPLNWQAFLYFLNKKGILESAVPQFLDIPNSFPKIFGVTLKLMGAQSKLTYAHGKHTNLDSAFAQAVGEALERSFLIYRKNRLSEGTIRLDELHPGFSAAIPNSTRGLASKSICRTMRVKELTANNKHTFAPIQFFMLGYVATDEPQLIHTTSTGAAGFFNRAGALVRGIYEALERDAFLIYWLNSLSPQIISIASIPSSYIQKVARKLRQARCDFYLLNITSDFGIPVCLGVIVNKQDSNRVVVSASAGADWLSICEKATKDVLTLTSGLFRKPRYELPQDFVPFKDKRVGRTERVALWTGEDMYQHANFLFSGNCIEFADLATCSISFETSEQELSYVIDLFKARNMSVFYHEAKHTLLRQLGFHVVKVVIPELVQFYLREDWVPVWSARLASAPEKMGYRRASHYNAVPHPYT